MSKEKEVVKMILVDPIKFEHVMKSFPYFPRNLKESMTDYEVYREYRRQVWEWFEELKKVLKEDPLKEE